MRIGIDVRHLTEPFSGIPSYVLRNINILKREKIEFILISDEKPLDIYDLDDDSLRIYGKKLRHARHLWKYHKFICKVAKEEKLDLLWMTTTEIPNCKIKSLKTIVTIHDAIPITNPEFHDWIGRLRFRTHLKKVLKTADGLLYVSQWSKDIVHELKNYAQKIKAIEMVVPPVITQENLYKDQVDKNIDFEEFLGNHFLFFLGALGRRKGVFLIKEVAKINENINFVLAGRKTNDLEEILKDKPNNLIILNNISDDKRHFLLSKCDAFIFPSYAEGFGMPVIEAMLAAKIVICSDLPIFKEVTDGNAIFFKSGDVNSFHKAIKNFYAMSQNEKTQMINNGLEAAQKYSENEVKRKLLNFFDLVISNE